jgi:hypothetical protein
VTSAIKVAIKRVAQKHSRLAPHLSATIRTGTYCCYRPDPQSNAAWHFWSRPSPTWRFVSSELTRC